MHCGWEEREAVDDIEEHAVQLEAVIARRSIDYFTNLYTGTTDWIFLRDSKNNDLLFAHKVMFYQLWPKHTGILDAIFQ